jgi:hypothetical protein
VCNLSSVADPWLAVPPDQRVICDMLRFLITSLEPPPTQDHDRQR